MESDHTETSLKSNKSYSEEENKRYQEMFAKDSKNNRRMWLKASIIFFICFVVYCLIGLSLSNHPIAAAFWIIGFFVIPLPALTPVFLADTKLKCPACRKNLFRSGLEVGNYCPECGAADLKLKGWLSSPYCDSCGKKFIEVKGVRNYKIRVCTYCGLLFSGKGY